MYTHIHIQANHEAEKAHTATQGVGARVGRVAARHSNAHNCHTYTCAVSPNNCA